MSLSSCRPRRFAFLASAFVATAAQAAPTTFYDLSQTPTPLGGIVPTVEASGAEAAAERLRFQTGSGSPQIPALTGVAIEDFEDFDLTSGAALGGLFGSGGSIGGRTTTALENQPFVGTGPEFSGRWNTTAPCNSNAGRCNWFSTSTSFTMAFGRSVSAFGFYGTDFGDFFATVTLSLLRLDSAGELGEVHAPMAIGRGSGNGSLIFYGIRDTDTPGYDGVRFNITQPVGAPPTATNRTDIFGFDDFIIGNVAQVAPPPPPPPPPNPAPEPGTIALAGLALAGLAAGRRRKSR